MLDPRQRSNSPFERSPLGGIGSILVGILILYLLFRLAAFVFQILWFLVPIIFIASLIIDHKVFLGYVGWIKSLFQRNWAYGLTAGVLSVVAFPLVALYLLGAALLKKKVKEARREADVRRNGEWAEYEEVSTEPMDLDIPYEELPPPPEPLPRDDKKRGNQYDELFD